MTSSQSTNIYPPVNTGPVNFRKIRTYGEILNTSFVFVRAYKSILWSMMLKLMLPYLIVFAGGLGLLMNGIFSMTETTRSGDVDDSMIGMLWNILFGLIVFVVIAIAALVANTTQMAFIGQIIQKGTHFSYDDVRKVVRKKFFPYLGMIIVIALCVGSIQQLFLFVVLVPATAISPLFGGVLYIVFYAFTLLASSITSMIPLPMFIDNAKGGNSPNRVFKVMKGNWWKTVGLDTTMTLVFYVMLTSLVIPIILAFGIAYLFAPGLFENATFVKDYKWLVIVYTSLNAISIAFAGFYLMIIKNVALALQYTNLVEQSEAFGLAQRVKYLLDTQTIEMEKNSPISSTPIFSSEAHSSSNTDVPNEQPNGDIINNEQTDTTITPLSDSPSDTQPLSSEQ